jgi:predicted type IV restriction endonuclease
LLEVKAVGLDLKDGYVKQAVDYAANQGVDWVVLTTGVLWRVYKITFAKPIDFEQVVEFNFLELNAKNEDHIELVYLLTKESWQQAMLGEYHAQKQALNRFILAALLLSDPVLDVVRRELRRISPGVRIETPEIQNALALDVLKREVTEGEKAEAARKIVQKASNRALRTAKAAADDVGEQQPPSTTIPPAEQRDVLTETRPDNSDEGRS